MSSASCEIWIVFTSSFILICSPSFSRILHANTSAAYRKSKALKGHTWRIPLPILEGFEVQPLFVTHASAFWHIISIHLIKEQPKLNFFKTFCRKFWFTVSNAFWKSKTKNSHFLFITFKIVYNILYKSNVETNMSTFQIAWVISTY